MYIRGFAKFQITVAFGLKFHWYLRTLSLKFQMFMIKIGVFLTLPSWLSQFSWDSQLGRVRKTSILVVNVWNFKLRVLKYQWNFSPNATVIWNLAKPLNCKYYTLSISSDALCVAKNLYSKWQKSIPDQLLVCGVGNIWMTWMIQSRL